MSLSTTIRKAFVPIHRDGWPFIAGFAVLSIVVGLFSAVLFWLGVLLTVWCAYFFRDPVRVTPVDERFAISPADGIVSFVGPAFAPRELELHGEMLRISVFLDVFSVHVNRAPVGGRIARIEYRPGKFLNADLDKSSAENERNGLVLESPHGPVGVVQVAGLVARRILCWPRAGDALQVGERFGLIRFGSRLDVYLPLDAAAPRVAVGQTAVAGETIIAEFGAGFTGLPLVRVG